ncbi:MAG: CAAX prenyl protease-related protein [Bryobacteraceae bacterium]
MAPFAVFMGLLALHSVWPLADLSDQILRVTVMTAVLWFVLRGPFRPALDLRVRHLAATVAIGVAVFALWIAPDLLIPGYRHFRLFDNAVTGRAATSLSASATIAWPVLALRMIRAVVIVPIVEELFWRAWLMRWLIDSDFQKVPLGKYTAFSFWTVAVLFASEHGPYWDVGLVAGIIYNWWMVRTRSLGDLILAHAVTNFVLSAYVIAAGKWEYWL